MAGWSLTDGRRDQALIADDLWIPPGGYAVLTRHGNPAANGGAHAHPVYTGLQLANDGIEQHLFATMGQTRCQRDGCGCLPDASFL